MRWILLLGALVFATPAVAAEADAPTYPIDTLRGPKWDLYGEARLRVDGLSDFAVDDLGTPHGRTFFGATRLIVGARYHPGPMLSLGLELEAFNGAVFGRTTDLGTSLDAFRVRRRSGLDRLVWVLPRMLFARIQRKGVRIDLGVQTFSWGMGILSNDGRQDLPFGEGRQGNVVARFGVVGTPFRHREDAGPARGLVVFGAADFVLRDDNAFVYRGDVAGQGLFGLRLAGDRGAFGFLAAVRYQRDRVDPNHTGLRNPWTVAAPLDIHLEGRPLEDGRRTLSLEAEAVAVLGITHRSQAEESVDGTGIRSGGALGRVRFDDAEVGVRAQLDVGFASGDADPRDPVSRAFSMHSDHRVGLVLFDQVLPMVTSRAADRIADPELSGNPAAGLRFAVAQGGATNAVFLYPTFRFNPIGGLDLRVGWLGAWAPTPFTDLYGTAEDGGWSRGWGEGDFYGQEVLGGAGYRFSLPQRFGVTVGVEASAFIAGAALERLDLGVPLGTVRGRLEVTW